MENMRRILVVCEVGSDCSEIVRDAAAIAREMRAQLFVLTVIYNPFGVEGLSFPRPSLKRDYRELLTGVTAELGKIAAREREKGVRVREMVRDGEPPLAAVLKVIREEQIDLLVLPAHRESRLEHFLFGRINNALLRKMPCSILFLRREPVAVEEEEEDAEEGEAGAAA